MWGLDDLDFTSGAGAGSSQGGSGGSGLGQGGSTQVGGGGGSIGGSGGTNCTHPCDDPPNEECYQGTAQCDPETGDCIYTPDLDGTTCAEATCGDYGACTWDGECSNSGTRYRSCTAYQCASGSCTPSDHEESDGCSRTVANGTTCGSGHYCCSNTCVARNHPSNCGSCGVTCGAMDCEEIIGHPGQYSCTCTSSTVCRNSGFGPGASCWDGSDDQRLCNCQCPSGTSCTGQCAGGGLCADITGHNYCHY